MDKTSYLVKQLKEGDKKAFSELYKDYSGAIYGLIIKMTRDEELSNDILQEVFVKAWQKIDSYNPEKGRFYTWLYRIARNTTLNHFRKTQKENYTGDFSVYENKAVFKELNIDALDLKGKVLNLDEKYRQVIELVYFQGFTHKQVHEQLELPMGTVKTRLRRAIEALAKIYKTDSVQIIILLTLICNYG